MGRQIGALTMMKCGAVWLLLSCPNIEDCWNSHWLKLQRYRSEWLWPDTPPQFLIIPSLPSITCAWHACPICLLLRCWFQLCYFHVQSLSKKALFKCCITLALLKNTDTSNNWNRRHSVIARDYFRVKSFLCGQLNSVPSSITDVCSFLIVLKFKPSVLQKPKLTFLSVLHGLTSCYCRSDQTCLR